VTSPPLAEATLTLSVQYGSTAYDSAYVALARRLSLPPVTDEALVRRFTGTGVDVRFLGAWPQ